jgi:2-oxo-hept-3-ene-1,7-dioate hydratase
LSEAEADRVARGLEAQLAGAPEVIGWKIGLNVPAVQQHLGLERPVVGHLTAGSLIGEGSTHSLAGGTRICVEPEVAIHLGEGGDIEGLGPAIEVVDLDPTISELQAILAGNVFHRGVVLGPISTGVGAGDLEALTATVTRNGTVEQSAGFGETGEHPQDVVRLVSERLALVGRELRAGQVIIAGSLTPLVPVAAGDRVEVDLGPLGAVRLSLA